MRTRAGVLLQARLGSTRLRNKTVLPLGDSTVIEQAMRALGELRADAYVLVCDERSLSTFQPLAARAGFEAFAGPEDDVLSRYEDAARQLELGTIVRATGDAPLVSAPLAQAIREIHEKAAADLSHYLGSPLGTGVEVISAAGLRRAAAATDDPFEREHLTQHMYRNRECFRVLEPRCEAALACDQHVTIDTREDYDRVRRIYAALYDGRPIDIGRLVGWLQSHG